MRGSCGGTTRLPEGHQWMDHVGLRQRLRVLRQTWARFEKLCKKSDYAAGTRERLLDLVVEQAERKGMPEEIMAMGLVLTSRVVADEQGIDWTTALNKVLNEAENDADARVDTSS